MIEPGYPAARAVAATVEGHFRRHIESAHAQGFAVSLPAPDASTVESIVDVAFWASLRREEGHSPKISLALLPPGNGGDAMRFARPLPLSADGLTRMAPAVERPGIHLGVWPVEGRLRVWGTTRTVPGYVMVLEVVEPGLLVIKHRRGSDTGKFGNVAVLQGDRIRVVDENAASLPDCPELLARLVGFGSPERWGDPADTLVELAASMRAHRRGGLLLVVPDGAEEWRESIVHPISYEVTPPLTDLAEVVALPEGTPGRAGRIRRAVDALAGLTAVDGATVMTRGYQLLAFGAKIARREGSRPVEELVVTEPIVGDRAVTLHPGQIGGTRHLSAAQFAYDQRDTLALVASQDGRFTVLGWSPCEERVHAHRVETLLL